MLYGVGAIADPGGIIIMNIVLARHIQLWITISCFTAPSQMNRTDAIVETTTTITIMTTG
jgi:hypothetical protein